MLHLPHLCLMESVLEGVSVDGEWREGYKRGSLHTLQSRDEVAGFVLLCVVGLYICLMNWIVLPLNNLDL